MGKILGRGTTHPIQYYVIEHDELSAEELEKEKEYINYINDHVSNVIEAFNRIFLPYLDNSNDITTFNTVSYEDLINAIKMKADTIKDHDASKYGNEEFVPYRMHWYPTSVEKSLSNDERKSIEDEYNEAVEHHYKNNPHHQKYWKNEDGSFRDMDLGSIIEMICDWEAMSKHFGQNTWEWYSSDDAEHERNNMTPKTKAIVEELLQKLLKK